MVMAFSSKEELKAFLKRIPHSETFLRIAKEDGDKFLTSIGFVKRKQPRKEDNTKYTGKEFCEMIGKEHKRIVANIGGNHTVAIIKGQVWDTWNSTEKTIGNYWEYHV